MNKQEVIKYCKEKAEEGYMTHLIILEIFNDEEEISDEVVDLICHLPEPPKPFILFVGSLEMINHLEQAMEDYGNALIQKGHAEESVKKVSKS